MHGGGAQNLTLDQEIMALNGRVLTGQGGGGRGRTTWGIRAMIFFGAIANFVNCKLIVDKRRCIQKRSLPFVLRSTLSSVMPPIPGLRSNGL